LKSVLAARKSSNLFYATDRDQELNHNVISLDSYRAQKQREAKRAARQMRYRFSFVSNLVLWLLVAAGFISMAAVMHNEQQLMEQQLSSPFKP